MRIGLLASVGPMLDSFFIEIVESWRAHGHAVSLAAGTPTRSGDSEVLSGLTRRPSLRTPLAFAQLRRWARRERLDVIVTNSATASALVRTAEETIPVVYFCHGLHWNECRGASDRLWQAVEASLVSRTAGVITINTDDRDWFSARIAGRRHLHLPTGVGLDLDRYPRSPQPAGPLRLVWIGEFSERKRPLLAVRTAADLRHRGVDFHLEMLGDGPLRAEAVSEIRDLGLTRTVAADGPGSAAEALAMSHALIHTATWEGLPRVMLEGLAVGRRSYAFDVKGVRDVPAAELSPDGQIADLAARIADDWSTGRLRQVPDFDRAALDCASTADAIESFLVETVTARGTGSARIDREAGVGRGTVRGADS